VSGIPAPDNVAAVPRRPIGFTILAVVFGLASASAFGEVVNYLLSRSEDPLALFAFQLATATTGLLSAVGIWRRALWAPLAVLSYGVVTATLVSLLGPMLDLAPEERSGLWTGAAAILVFALLSAWYVHHVARRASLSAPEARDRPV
jgi:hypothetical protein